MIIFGNDFYNFKMDLIENLIKKMRTSEVEEL